MIPWLEGNHPFPPLESALREPNGLLAAGGELNPQRLLNAYQNGIFPWFSDGDPILWWSPDPRMVLIPGEFRLSRSLKKRLRRDEFEVTTDTAFRRVMSACAATPRAGQNGTWIVDEIIDAYVALHELGAAHSVECWQIDAKGDRQLVGGLYGVCLGRMFYGESMFAHVTDASKVAFAQLVHWLRNNQVEMIDCQMNTAHLASLGAREISRQTFTQQLSALTARPGFAWPSGHWQFSG
jgi:leucyl/phenylalanyl-tRNA--protein transferase